MSNDRFVIPAPPLPSMTESQGEGSAKRSFVSRAGHKLEAALVAFGIDVTGRVCADLGANVGGFTDCLLRYGAAKVYAVDTAYGVLAWTLRKDPRVVVKDRMNALHARLPERVGLIAVDVGWTRQEKVLPTLPALMSAGDAAQSGDVLTLIKPHYESELAKIQRGVLTPGQSEAVLWEVIDRVQLTWDVKGIVKSPLEGQKGNVEYVAWLRQRTSDAGKPTRSDDGT